MVQYAQFILGQFLFLEPVLRLKPDDDDDDDDDDGNDTFLEIVACIFHDWFSQIGWGTFCHQALSASRFCPVAGQGWTSTPLGFGDSIWKNHVAQHIPSQIRYVSNDTCQLPNAISLWG